LIGYFVKRYDFVVAGQIFPNVPEGLPSYLPTFMEMLLIGGIIAALLMAYTLGAWILPLKEERLSKKS
jgi:Ni/Fe-hydrogenase subunit HybB-like protein